MAATGKLQRPDMLVVTRMLERLQAATRPYGKTELQLACRINYSIFQRYLQWFTTKGLVEITKDDAVVITDKGRQLYQTIGSWMKDLFSES